jgi:major membrane immunogen (membrane-anchored lipoprotein)
MIKKTIFAFFILTLMAFSGDGPYNDGIYHGISRAIYVDEPYYGFSRIAIENGKIIKVDFIVRDSAKHENFDDKYERYFADNDEYVQQCRNDWKGIKSYPDSLIKYQDINKVDVISGATWSYNIFKASAKEALATAENSKK